MKLSTRINTKAQMLTRRRSHKTKKVRQARHRKARKLALFAVSILYFASVIAAFGALNYLHALNKDLPELDRPFNAYGFTSRILDRKGTELYRISDEYLRAKLELDDAPEYVKWAFIAGEDMQFYSHPGFDPVAMARCSLYLVDSSSSFCGGSTITQQLIKLTSLGNEVTIDRKLKEVLMSVKLEGVYQKEDILEQYLSVVPMGSNIYGITMGAEFYFGKKPQDLSLAQTTLLAAIIQDPIYSSPTLGLPDEKTATAKAVKRQKYVLDQLQNNIQFINEEHRRVEGDPELDDVLTQEMIDQARAEELKFRSPIFANKKAGHFVDYVQKLLTTRPYKNGEPFTATDLAIGGYTIYTTLDYDVQRIAEQTTKQMANSAQSNYGGYNAAMITLQPKTGEVLAMVGSKDYYGTSEKCSKKRGCKFTPQVNVMATKQSPGSSTKPFGMYEAYRRGTLYTGSLLPDVPVDVGGGYNLKNWNGTFFGVSPKTTAATMLCESRNLPAVITLESIGIPAFLDTMKKFGYSTYSANKAQYGHSVVLGGADVLGIEHAQAYGVFANGGNFVQHEVIKKIVDKDGNVVYEHKPEVKKVGDPRAAHMINHSLLNCFQSSWDGRQVASKTGTSQDNADGWTVMYSPDFVTVGWVGNNNNDPMSINAFGVTAVMPHLKSFMKQVGESQYFKAKSGFKQPGGLKWDGGNVINGRQYGFTRGLMYAERNPRIDVIYNVKTVCGSNGKPQGKSSPYYIMPVQHWQYFLNAYLWSKGVPNGGPANQQCSTP